MRKIARIDHFGIGADFYRADERTIAAGVRNITRYPYLFAELPRRGYSVEDVLTIAGRKHLRAMRRMEEIATDLQRTESLLISEGIKAA